MRIFTIDTRSLRLFRISLGLLILWDLFDRSHALTAHYTNQGVLATDGPVPLSIYFIYVSVYSLGNSVLAQATFMVVHALVAMWLISGWRDRWATVACFAMTLSLQHRNPLILYGADDVLRLSLLWCMFLPDSGSWKTPRRLNSPATAAVMCQIAVIFFAAGIHKIFDPAWRRGDGVLLGVAAAPGVLSDLILNHATLFRYSSVPVMAMQIFGSLALLTNSFRLPAVVGFALLHLAMAAAMDLSMFPFTVIAGLIPFIPSWVWDLGKKAQAAPIPSASAVRVWAAAVAVGVVIPLGGEIFETTEPRGIGYNFYIATGLRQHWRLFTPVPWSTEWSAFLGQRKDQTLFDLGENRVFTGWHEPSGNLWARQRWGPLAKSMAENQTLATHLAKHICENYPLESVHFHRLSRGLTAADRNPSSWQSRSTLDYNCP